MKIPQYGIYGRYINVNFAVLFNSFALGIQHCESCLKRDMYIGLWQAPSTYTVELVVLLFVKHPGDARRFWKCGGRNRKVEIFFLGERALLLYIMSCINISLRKALFWTKQKRKGRKDRATLVHPVPEPLKTLSQKKYFRI